MIETPWIAATAGFLLTATVAYTLIPLARTVALRYDIVDSPGGYKVQRAPVPYLGGPAMAIATTVVLLGAAPAVASGRIWFELAVILGLASVLAVVGLVDDVRGLSPWTRLGFQIAVAVVAWTTGNGVSLLGEPFDLVLTVAWIVGVTNAFNLLDNMDGLSAGVAAIAASGLAILGVISGQFLVAALAASLAGSAVAFLRFNYEPADIYMGDAGSLYLGFLLAIVGLRVEFLGPDSASWFIAPLVVVVPIADTTMVVVSRIRRGVSPFSGGRDHLSHRLVERGFTTRGAVGVLYLWSAFGVLLATLLAATTASVGVIVAAVFAGASIWGALRIGLSASVATQSSR